MPRRQGSKFVALSLLCLCLIPLLAAKNPAPAPTNAAYDAGVKLYNQKSYKAASQQFETAMQQMPNSPDVIYYCALCSQLCGNRTRAKQLFEYIGQRFPQSRVAPMAQSALSQLATLSGGSGGGAVESSGASSGTGGVASYGGGSHSSSGSAGTDADLAGVPELVRVPFEKRGNDVTVQVQVNGRTQEFILDTGASGVAIGMNHLKEWGIGSSVGKDTFQISGVGDGAKARGWTQPLDLKLGQIYRKSFPCMIQEYMPTEPLLGQTFLKSFNVSIDDNSRMVLLAKKGGIASKDLAHRSYSGIEIPFTRGGGGHMMVNTIINGKPLLMMFDTGCEQTAFSMNDWKKLGFEVPGNARQSIAHGVLGDTTCYVFNCDQIKLLGGRGQAIEQEGSPCSVTEGSPASLLGMSFYGKYKYTIDSSRNVIIFEGVER